ncbi:MAG TPA: hypothetical protein DCS93_25230 [Microscillaceae bacterium]|nr:hypothetical protein [Microscillaceae bacterium]
MGYTFEIIIEEKESHYEAYSPKIPACRAQGESYEIALQKTHEALQAYVGRLSSDDLDKLTNAPQ